MPKHPGIVGLSVCRDDGVHHCPHRDGAKVLGWGLRHPAVYRFVRRVYRDSSERARSLTHDKDVTTATWFRGIERHRD